MKYLQFIAGTIGALVVLAIMNKIFGWSENEREYILMLTFIWLILSGMEDRILARLKILEKQFGGFERNQQVAELQQMEAQAKL